MVKKKEANCPVCYKIIKNPVFKFQLCVECQKKQDDYNRKGCIITWLKK